jgi:hypothetical protein
MGTQSEFIHLPLKSGNSYFFRNLLVVFAIPLQIFIPRRLVPNLKALEHARDHHFLFQGRMLPQKRGNQDPSLIIEMTFLGTRNEMSHESPVIRLDEREILNFGLYFLPGLGGICHEAVVHPGNDQGVLEVALQDFAKL